MHFVARLFGVVLATMYVCLCSEVLRDASLFVLVGKLFLLCKVVAAAAVAARAAAGGSLNTMYIICQVSAQQVASGLNSQQFRWHLVRKRRKLFTCSAAIYNEI